MTGPWLGARRREIAELEQRLRDTEARLAGVVRSQRCAGLDDLTGLGYQAIVCSTRCSGVNGIGPDATTLRCPFSSSRSTT